MATLRKIARKSVGGAAEPPSPTAAIQEWVTAKIEAETQTSYAKALAGNVLKVMEAARVTSVDIPDWGRCTVVAPESLVVTDEAGLMAALPASFRKQVFVPRTGYDINMKALAELVAAGHVKASKIEPFLDVVPKTKYPKWTPVGQKGGE